MPRPTLLPHELGDEFTYARARAAGVSARRLRARDLEAPHRGVRLRLLDDPAGVDDDPGAADRRARRALLRRAHAYREIMPAHAFFVGRTAAVIHGIPLHAGGPLEVAVAAPHRAPRAAGIRSRQVSPSLVFVREVDGLPVASPASAWAMLGVELSVRELVIIGDAIVAVPRGPGGRRVGMRSLATVDELARAASQRRRRGSPRLRRALALIRVGSSSPLESELRLDAETAGLPEPELDVEVRDTKGQLLGISELVYREFGTIVEVEGDHHRTSRAQWNRDIDKYAAYAAQGWEVVRLTSRHIRTEHPRGVAMVRAALVRHGWRP